MTEPEDYFLSAMPHWDRLELSDAKRLLRKAVETDPADERPRYYLGAILYAEGEFGEAERWFQHALSGPEGLKAKLGLALVADRHGKPGDAEELFLEVLEAEQSAVHHNMYADFLASQDRLTEYPFRAPHLGPGTGSVVRSRGGVRA